jgi:hypothetical protein
MPPWQLRYELPVDEKRGAEKITVLGQNENLSITPFNEGRPLE